LVLSALPPMSGNLDGTLLSARGTLRALIMALRQNFEPQVDICQAKIRHSGAPHALSTQLCTIFE
jgi:hypothetical protein